MDEITTIVAAVFGSTGLWTLIQYIVQKKTEKDSKQSKMLKGLAFDRICYLASSYIERGWITREEYQNLHDYLYQPYKDLDGDGTAERLMEEVRKLPIKEEGA